MTSKDALQGIRNLPNRGTVPGRLHRQLQEVATLLLGRFRQSIEGATNRPLVALGTDLLEALDLLRQDLAIVDIKDLEVIPGFRLIFVDPDDGLLPAVDAGLSAGSRLLDTHLRHPALDRLGHAAHLFHFGDELARLL